MDFADKLEMVRLMANETKIYVELAKKFSSNRTRFYSLLNNLIGKGYVSHYRLRGLSTLFFTCSW
jgi:sugar-specific transcriptional regulator TrmB